MRAWAAELEEKLVDAGAKFIRYTTAGHKMYTLGQRQIMIPTKNVAEHGHLRSNKTAEVEKAIRDFNKSNDVPEKPREAVGMKPSEVEDLTPPMEPKQAPAETPTAVALAEEPAPVVASSEPILQTPVAEHACVFCGRTDFRSRGDVNRHITRKHKAERDSMAGARPSNNHSARSMPSTPDSRSVSGIIDNITDLLVELANRVEVDIMTLRSQNEGLARRNKELEESLAQMRQTFDRLFER